MTEVGQIHVGDMINVFRHGSLVMENLGDSSTQHSGSVLYGTVQGAIGMFHFYLIYDIQNFVNQAYFGSLCTVKLIESFHNCAVFV